MKNALIFKRILCFLLLFVMLISMSLTAFADSDLIFGYSTQIKDESGDEVQFGNLMWIALIAVFALLIIAAIINLIRLKKEAKASGKKEKPKLIIKKRFKN